MNYRKIFLFSAALLFISCKETERKDLRSTTTFRSIKSTPTVFVTESDSKYKTVPYPAAVETIKLERKDHHWHDGDIQPYCDALVQKHSTVGIRVTRISFDDLIFGNNCYERDWKRKCVKWIKKVTVTCTLERETILDESPASVSNG